jgi:hypothetical protein
MDALSGFLALAEGEYLGSVDGEHTEKKKQFHKLGKKVAKELAEALGWKKGTYDIRSNMSGTAGSGEITLHGETIYVCFTQGATRSEFMWRTCKSRKDYTGGHNHWAAWQDLADIHTLALTMNHVVARNQS